MRKMVKSSKTSQALDLPQERQQYIIEMLQSQGKVLVTELSLNFDVSVDTIRRDLRELANEGLLKRVHGGALPISNQGASYKERSQTQSTVKAELAGMVHHLVSDGQLILFGSGSTNVEIAKKLPLNLRATAVTPNLKAAIQLAEYPNIEVILLGGRVSKQEMVACDASTVDLIKRFQADICFLGVCSLHPEAGYTTRCYDEVALNQALIAQSSDIVATVTADKLGTVAPYYVSGLEEITHIITESDIPLTEINPYREKGITIIQTAGPVD